MIVFDRATVDHIVKSVEHRTGLSFERVFYQRALAHGRTSLELPCPQMGPNCFIRFTRRADLATLRGAFRIEVFSR